MNKNELNYLKYSRTEMFYECIKPVKDTLYNKKLTVEDKLILIDKIINEFYKNQKNV